MTTTKRTTSFLMVLVMILSLFTGIVPVYAAEEIGEVYQVEYPRGGGYGDSWGHSQLNLMGGWTAADTEAFTTRSMDSYTGQILYCIEPGVGQYTGDQLTSKGEYFWENYPDNLNPTIDPDTIKSHIGRILQYGYTGNNTSQWDVINNADDQNTIAEIYATQALIWETVVGERDENFGHVDPSGYGKDAVMEIVQSNHPLRSLIYSHYNRIEASVQNHDVIPSFMSRSQSQARSYEMEWDGSQYVLELRDSNGVLSNYDISSSTSGISVSQSGNTLTITASEAPTGSVTLSASKSSARMGVVVWTDGTVSNSNSGHIQDLVTWGERVSDPVYAYMKLEVSYGEAKIVKHSEDGKVSGIKFNISGNGINETVTTGSDGSISIPNLAPGRYTVTEVTENRYEPQQPQTVEVVSGRTATVTFSNVLKRGDLIVTKTSEDGLVKGVKFRLYGTSLSGLAVDEYAVTDDSGIARFDDVLISGSTPYTLEEVDTAIRYVVPADQQAPVLWNEVTERSFHNILKKFRVEVVKQDVETGSPQGDATLAGAVYGLYQDGKLVDSYTTDSSGSFVTDYYVCDSNWTLKEISPSEGYLLDTTVHKIPAEPGNFTVELNPISEDVTEEVIKGNIRLIKHIDREDTDAALDTDPDSTEKVETETVAEEAPAPESAPVSDHPEQAPATEDATALAEPPVMEDAKEALADDTAPVAEAETESESADAQPEETPAADDPVPEGDSSEADAAQSDVEEPAPTEDGAPDTEGEGTEADAAQSDAGESDTTVVEIPEELQPVVVPEEDIESSGGESMIEQPEENAKFQIYLASAGSYDAAKESERDILVTDADGLAVSKDMPYGRYRVHQIEGMEGQGFIPDFTVFISEEGQTYSYIINNATASSFIRVEKRDIETGKIIPAANIGFQVKDLSTGELVTQTVYYPTPVEITTFFTNDEGWMMLPYELDYGQYELLELQTAYGYVLDTEPVPFMVDGSETIVTVEKYNMAQKGVIKLQKTGEVFQSVSEQEGIYQPVYEVKGLAGATYKIVAAEDIVTLDGTARYQKDELVDTITTGADGWAESKPLYLGRYTIVEQSAPEPMVLNTESQTVELTYAGQEIELTETSAGFYNERQKVEISLTKAMEVDEIFRIGMNDELGSVTFGLYAAEALTAADGTAIPADGLIEIVSIGTDGKAICRTDLPLGSFYLQERTTNNQYMLSEDKYPVTFSYAGQDTAVVKIAANDGNTIVNELIYGSVSGMKKDEDGNGLGGAVIGLFAANEGEFTKDSAVLTTTSAEDGSFRFEKVPYGTWFVREIEQPEGYLLCTEVFPVEIKEDEQVIEISITNERIRGNLSLTKVDADYPDNKLSGAEFEVYRDVNGNKELDKEDTLLGIMEETETGFYEMKDIEYGGVLVREKTAPEGFYLDEGVYYISIETDGETYVVENDAGHGFINQGHRGHLKIVKTSSDGKVDGFTFRVVGEDYDRTFVTGSDGIILIEDLRVGKYTITELEDELSAGYKRPAPVTVELVTDETLTVNVHNEKVTVDVPKTGDDTNMWLWIGLMGLAVLGIGAAIAVPQLKKKKSGKFSKKK